MLQAKCQFFQLVSVAEETGLSLALSETPKTRFVASAQIILYINLHNKDRIIHYMGQDATKLVFGVSEKVRFKPAC